MLVSHMPVRRFEEAAVHTALVIIEAHSQYLTRMPVPAGSSRPGRGREPRRSSKKKVAGHWQWDFGAAEILNSATVG
jgi:hypothetical protein